MPNMTSKRKVEKYILNYLKERTRQFCPTRPQRENWKSMSYMTRKREHLFHITSKSQLENCVMYMTLKTERKVLSYMTSNRELETVDHNLKETTWTFCPTWLQRDNWKDSNTWPQRDNWKVLSYMTSKRQREQFDIYDLK